MKCNILKIKKSDLSLVGYFETKFENSSLDNKSIVINHSEDAYGFGSGSLSFSISVTNKNTPRITNIDFDVAVRTKIDLAENHASESVATNIGRNLFAYKGDLQDPKIPYQQNYLFKELKGKNG